LIYPGSNDSPKAFKLEISCGWANIEHTLGPVHRCGRFVSAEVRKPALACNLGSLLWPNLPGLMPMQPT
jgi:hypothetical protein